MTIYDDLYKEQYDLLISKNNEWFQGVQKKIAENEEATYTKFKKQHDQWMFNYDQWISKYNREQLDQKIIAEAIGSDNHYTPEQRKLHFLSERGDLSVNEWNENSYKHYLARGGKDVDAKVSSSNVIKPEISSDTIINDTNKEISITDTENETSVVAESASDKEEKTVLESSAISNEPEVAVAIADSDAELPNDSNENPSTIPPYFDNSNDDNKEISITDTANEISVVAESASDKEEKTVLKSFATSNESEFVVAIADPAAELSSDSNETTATIISPSFDNSPSETIEPAEEATNFYAVSGRLDLDDFYSSISNTNDAICTVKATNTKSAFTSLVHTFTSKCSSLWHSLTNSIHSKNESTGDTLDVKSSSDSSFADNFNDVKEHDIHCVGEVPLDTGMFGSIL